MKHDVVIVGNGSIGWSTAIKIKRKAPHLSVCVRGPEYYPMPASIAAAAMLNVFAEVDKNTFKTPAHTAKFELAVEATGLWPTWVQELENLSGERVHIGMGTTVKGFTCDDVTSLYRMRDALRDYGTFYEFDEQKYELYIPSEGYINSDKLLVALQLTAQRIGVDYVNSCVERIDPVAKTAESCAYTNHFDKLVICAGAYGPKLLPPDVKIQHTAFGLGTSFTVRLPGHGIEHVQRTPARHDSCGLVIVPRNEDELYIGASSRVVEQPEPYWPVKPRVGTLQTLIQLASQVLGVGTALAELLEVRTAYRPLTEDGLPLIGETSVKDVFIITGTRRDGLHMSPLLADDMASRVLGDGYENDVITQYLAPERRPVHGA